MNQYITILESNSINNNNQITLNIPNFMRKASIGFSFLFFDVDCCQQPPDRRINKQRCMLTSRRLLKS